MPVFDLAKIEEKIDKTVTGAMGASEPSGGVRFQNVLEVIEFAKLMAIADKAVPKHLRGNPGICLAVCMQALEWRMSPFSVANKSYEVNDRIAYESQLVHAVIEQRAPIKERLKHRFEGEGDARVCIVWATPRGENEPLEWKSPLFKDIQPKNSPLWKTKRDLQQYYNTSRDWCRVYFPDVLLGVYARDEFDDDAPSFDRARDVSPSATGLIERLTKAEPPTEGFSPGNLSAIDAEVVELATPANEMPPDDDDPTPPGQGSAVANAEKAA